MRRALAPAVAAALVLAAPAAAAKTVTIRGDAAIGSFRVKADGTLAGAIEAFGDPTSKRRRGISCRVIWTSDGLLIDFYNLGGRNSCTPRFGFFSRAVMHGRGWRTSKGLAIGDPVAKLRRLYPSARFHRGSRGFWPSGWWLVPRIYYPVSAEPVPGLLAEVRRGRVFSFQVRYQAGGE